MPTSHPNQINEVVKIAQCVKPKSVLDIGVGFGKYGFLMREYLDLSRADKCVDGEFTRTIRIDGIEAFKDYIGPLQKNIYDKIYIGNALEVIPKLDTKYDLVLLMDVFEHFSYEEGMSLIKMLQAKSNNLLISTPQNVQEQGAEFGNIYETHKFEWRKKHYDKFPEKTFINNTYSLIVFIGKDARKVKQLFSKFSQAAKKFKRRFSMVNIKIWVSSRFPLIKKMHTALFK